MTLAGQGDQRVGDIVARGQRHQGCDGAPALAELVTGIPDSSSGTVRRVVLVGDS